MKESTDDEEVQVMIVRHTEDTDGVEGIADEESTNDEEAAGDGSTER